MPNTTGQLSNDMSNMIQKVSGLADVLKGLQGVAQGVFMTLGQLSETFGTQLARVQQQTGGEAPFLTSRGSQIQEEMVVAMARKAARDMDPSQNPDLYVDPTRPIGGRLKLKEPQRVGDELIRFVHQDTEKRTEHFTDAIRRQFVSEAIRAGGPGPGQLPEEKPAPEGLKFESEPTLDIGLGRSRAGIGYSPTDLARVASEAREFRPGGEGEDKIAKVLSQLSDKNDEISRTLVSQLNQLRASITSNTTELDKAAEAYRNVMKNEQATEAQRQAATERLTAAMGKLDADIQGVRDIERFGGGGGGEGPGGLNLRQKADLAQRGAAFLGAGLGVIGAGAQLYMQTGLAQDRAVYGGELRAATAEGAQAAKNFNITMESHDMTNPENILRYGADVLMPGRKFDYIGRQGIENSNRIAEQMLRFRQDMDRQERAANETRGAVNLGIGLAQMAGGAIMVGAGLLGAPETGGLSLAAVAAGATMFGSGLSSMAGGSERMISSAEGMANSYIGSRATAREGGLANGLTGAIGRLRHGAGWDELAAAAQRAQTMEDQLQVINDMRALQDAEMQRMIPQKIALGEILDTVQARKEGAILIGRYAGQSQIMAELTAQGTVSPEEQEWRNAIDKSGGGLGVKPAPYVSHFSILSASRETALKKQLELNEAEQKKYEQAVDDKKYEGLGVVDKFLVWTGAKKWKPTPAGPWANAIKYGQMLKKDLENSLENRQTLLMEKREAYQRDLDNLQRSDVQHKSEDELVKERDEIQQLSADINDEKARRSAGTAEAKGGGPARSTPVSREMTISDIARIALGPGGVPSGGHAGEFGAHREGHGHTGQDLGVPGNVAGTPINAILPGRVVYSGRAGNLGNMVAVETRIGRDVFWAEYGHDRDLLANVGQQVGVGTPIATMGATGEQGISPHLHLQVSRRLVDAAGRVIPESAREVQARGGFIDPAHLPPELVNLIAQNAVMPPPTRLPGSLDQGTVAAAMNVPSPAMVDSRAARLEMSPAEFMRQQFQLSNLIGNRAAAIDFGTTTLTPAQMSIYERGRLQGGIASLDETERMIRLGRSGLGSYEQQLNALGALNQARGGQDNTRVLEAVLASAVAAGFDKSRTAQMFVSHTTHLMDALNLRSGERTAEQLRMGAEILGGGRADERSMREAANSMQALGAYTGQAGGITGALKVLASAKSGTMESMGLVGRMNLAEMEDTLRTYEQMRAHPERQDQLMRRLSPRGRDIILQEGGLEGGGLDRAISGVQTAINYQQGSLRSQINKFGAQIDPVTHQRIDPEEILKGYREAKTQEERSRFAARYSAAAHEAAAKLNMTEQAGSAAAVDILMSQLPESISPEAREARRKELNRIIGEGNKVYKDQANVHRRNFIDSLTANMGADIKTVSPEQYRQYLKSGGSPLSIPEGIDLSAEDRKAVRRALSNPEDFNRATAPGATGVVPQAVRQALQETTKLDLLRNSEMAAETAGGGVQQVHIANFYDMVYPMSMALRMDRSPEGSGKKDHNSGTGKGK